MKLHPFLDIIEELVHIDADWNASSGPQCLSAAMPSASVAGYWLNFSTQAGWASNSPGNSGSSTVRVPPADLTRSRAVEPSRLRVVGFTPVYPVKVNCRPGQRGRIA